MSALVTPTSTPLESVPGLGDGLVEKLGAAGITTVEALADMTPEQLEAIEGIGPKTVEKISLAVNNYFASLDGGEVVAEAPEGEALAEETAPAEEGAEPVELAASEEPPVGETPGQEALSEDASSEEEPKES
jgi:N utilization substance protein A